MIRTTLNLDEGCMKQLKRLAAEQNRTLTDLVGEILAEGLQLREQRSSVQAPRLLSYPMGVAKVDLASRQAIEEMLPR
jgi:hypothetical protein